VIDEHASLTDVAFIVCTALDAVGTTSVLTGGSAATFYAPDAYQSSDLDFVITFSGPEKGAAVKALSQLGYALDGACYVHPRSPFPIEFPRGPLMVGDDHITTWATVTRGEQRLHVLNPTDSCRDRLAALLFWKDYSGLEQALAVYRVRHAEIDLAAIRDWCDRERQPTAYATFETRLRALGLIG
jgi:hypothetical protein